MKKGKGGAFVNDIDILGDIGEDSTNEVDETIDDVAVFGKEDEPTEAPAVTAEPVVEEVATAVEDIVSEEPKVEETKEGETEEDLDKRLDDLLKSSAEVDDKVEEVKDAVATNGDENIVKLVDELQTLIAEKNLEIEELKKSKEISDNRYLSKFGDEEELSLYRPEIEKMQSNPRLMALVKYSDTDNEKIKPKLVSILSDMIYKLTGQDISDLLDEKDKAALSVLNTPSSDNPPISENKVQEDKNADYEDSVNNILGF